MERIHDQIQLDYQMLQTYAQTVSGGDLADREEFAAILRSSNAMNEFVSMEYYSKDERGIVAEDDQVRITGLNDETEEKQKCIRKALKGEKNISGIYEVQGHDVFLCAVPVRRDGVVQGAIAASSQIWVLSDIVNELDREYDEGSAFIINQEGQMLVRPEEPLFDPGIHTVMEEPFSATDEDRAELKEAMKEEAIYNFSFSYKKEMYEAVIYPVSMNQWSFFSVNSLKKGIDFIYLVVGIVGFAFMIVLIIICFMLYQGYRMDRKNVSRLVSMAHYDEVTKAFNFRRFHQLAAKELQKDSNGCIVAMNIYRFKFINEIFGREAADRLLCFVKRNIEESLNDNEIFCRESADSFYIFLRETDKIKIGRRMNSIMEKITKTPVSYNKTYRLMMYCGCAVSGGEREVCQIEQLMGYVMLALAKAKGIHQNTIWFFDDQMHRQEMTKNEIESHMEEALKNKEFKMYLQPQINMSDNKIGGAEVLVRWIRDDGQLYMPMQFIPVFEENGFCVQLDLYMIRQTCERLRMWMDKGIDPIPLSVNQSKRTFFEPGYVERLQEILEEYRIPPRVIKLEILENLALENEDSFIKIIADLRKKGLGISLDDFGSGYSSLNILAKLQIDEVKLDRGFLCEISGNENQKSKLIMGQIVNLAKSMSIKTVVEGVENEEHDRLIRELECDLGQGYYYGKPKKIEEIDG